MIDERFLVAAVNIRKKYLSLSDDLNTYRNKAESILGDLENAKDSLSKIEDGNYDKENVSGIQKIVDIITDLEESQDGLEKFLEPINKNIEKLLIEEKDLYDKICQKHSNYTEEQIVNFVKMRLEKENLL
jgi:hypothetical protein